MRPFLALASACFKANFKRLTHPMKILFRVTDACNSRCVTCSIWRRTPQEELDLDEVRKVFASVRRLSWVDLTGGEVLLRRDFVELTEAIVSSQPKLLLLHYATNALCKGTVEKTLYLKRELKPPRFMVTVSCDGYPELHDRVRGVPNGWSKAVDAFRRLRAHNDDHFKVVLGMTLSGHNIDAFPRTLEAVRQVIPDISYRDFHLNIAQEAEYYGNLGSLSQVPAEQLAARLDEFRALRGRSLLSPVDYLESEYQRLGKTFTRTRRSPLPCRSLAVSLVLDPRGWVHPCTMWDRPVANVRDHGYDLLSIWRGAEARQIQREIERGSCPHCWTPCEAYQTIMANFLGLRTLRGA